MGMPAKHCNREISRKNEQVAKYSRWCSPSCWHVRAVPAAALRLLELHAFRMAENESKLTNVKEVCPLLIGLRALTISVVIA